MPDQDYTGAVNAHYGADDPIVRIQDVLRAMGKDKANLTPADLAQFDQLHTGGEAATRDWSARVGLRADMDVIDVGGGLGGPARMLAATFGCKVTVLDLTAEFCRAGATLTEWVGLSDKVKFQQGSAFDMPFGDGEFDLAWTQHSSMNMPDKESLYSEITRVLKPGGRLAMHEIIAGDQPAIYYPLPWAPDASISFVLDESHLRAVIAAAGFKQELWEDITPAALSWLAAWQERLRAGIRTPLPGIQPADNDAMPGQFGNLARSLHEGRLRVIRAIFAGPESLVSDQRAAVSV